MASQSVKHVLVMTVLVVSDRNPNQMSLCKNKREAKSSCHSKVSGQGKLQEQLDPVTQLLSLGLDSVPLSLSGADGPQFV